MAWEGIVHRYRDYLPVNEKTPVQSLKEGNTPLIKASNIAASMLGGGIELYFKFDGANPTGSFKDRGMAMAISKALENGSMAVICASTGNTSASAAAYAAKAGIKCIVIIPEGKIAFGKLAQALVHGASVIQVNGNFDKALKLVKAIADEYPVKLVNSINPYRLQGQKTAAFEICDELGGAPKYHSLPVGNAGNITAYWMGFKEYHKAGRVGSLPVMLGFQASGAAPLVLGRPVDRPETVATAIRIGKPASWDGAIAARDESGGRIEAVADDEILAAYSAVASMEGIFCEPASAASVAGVVKLYDEGYFKSGEIVVCTLTGHGLKDPDTAIGISKEPLKIEADLDAVRKVVEQII